MELGYAAIIDFWYRELTPRQWFVGGGAELDELIRKRFGSLLEDAKRGALDEWAESPRGRLALIIVLDQFSRNACRGLPEAFAADAKAQQLAREGIEAGMDKPLNMAERHFFYMPLMHAEDAELQRLSIEKFTALRDDAESLLDFAKDHCSIVERFGRFPYRNSALGRSATPEEDEYLASKQSQSS